MVVCLWSACDSGTTAERALIGSWSNVDLQVLVNQGNPSDSGYQFLVPEGEWENTLNIKPIITEFKRNGIYNSEYRSLEDSLIRKTEGQWRIMGDTLSLIEDGTVNRYHMKFTGDRVTFTGWLDWDQDGDTDDLYSGKQQKI
ncbi:MAG: hypothetical protein DHS20C17_33620 [Cyclobacteriaceae bacterium]|nr:MAG: hypothetical protein DHS20C17_33620 [Cyclobacteriaceae bacterium]